VVATQSIPDATHGPRILDLLASGVAPDEAIDAVLEGDDAAAGPVAELTVDDVGYRLPAGTARLLEVEVEAKGPGGMATVQALLAALAEGFPEELRPWPYGKLATGLAAERLLNEGRLDGLLDPAVEAYIRRRRLYRVEPPSFRA
jgi:hypothetical protein